MARKRTPVPKVKVAKSPKAKVTKVSPKVTTRVEKIKIGKVKPNMAKMEKDALATLKLKRKSIKDANRRPRNKGRS